MSNSQQFSWAALSSTLIAIALTIVTLTACWNQATDKRGSSKDISNCKQIITALRLYASDHDGHYPDGKDLAVNSSNKAFHKLFTDGILDAEGIFSCSGSPFQPDGNYGNPPEFLEAVKPGENHWAMTQGLTDSSPGYIPLVFENPVVATWPPQWNARAAGTAVKGRAWRGDLIILGQNDSSVTVQKLASRWSKAVSLAPGKDGKNLFEAAIDPVHYPTGAVLDVEQ